MDIGYVEMDSGQMKVSESIITMFDILIESMSREMWWRIHCVHKCYYKMTLKTLIEIQ